MTFSTINLSDKTNWVCMLANNATRSYSIPLPLTKKEQWIIKRCCTVIDILLAINEGKKVALLLVPLSQESIRISIAQVYCERGMRVEFLESLNPGLYWINVFPARHFQKSSATQQ